MIIKMHIGKCIFTETANPMYNSIRLKLCTLSLILTHPGFVTKLCTVLC